MTLTKFPEIRQPVIFDGPAKSRKSPASASWTDAKDFPAAVVLVSFHLED